MRYFYQISLISLFAMSPLTSRAADSSTEHALPLIKVVQKIEKEGFSSINEVSWDDGHWEVEAMQGKDSYELTVDSTSGKVLSQHRDDLDQQPPEDSLALSELLQKLSDNLGYKEVDEVSFERRYWEVEVFKDGQKRELHVDPLTADVIADRVDD